MSTRSALLSQPTLDLFDTPLFPTTRYQGSKLKLVNWIKANIQNLEFDTALDAFGGTGCISFMLKGLGKEVTYNVTELKETIPTVYLEAQVLRCAQTLKERGKRVPDIVMAGGFVNETQILKAIALSNFGGGPYVKAAVIGRAGLTAAMKAEYFVRLAKEGEVPKHFSDLYGTEPEKFFAFLPELKARFGNEVKNVPWGSLGFYGYMERVKVGLQQLLAGLRKFKLNLVSREDIFVLTERAAKATRIPLAEEAGIEEMEKILLDD